MKKITIVFLLILTTINLFAKEQIGTCNKNVYNVGVIQNNVPVCFCFEETQGLISTIKKYYVKVGNNEFGPYDFIDSCLFTSDKIIYTAKQNDKWGLFANGQNLGYYKGISNFFISDDKKTLSYAFESETGVYIKCGEKQLGPFEGLKYFLVSDDKIISYVVNEKSKYYIYAKNKKYGPFDDVSDWKFQTDSFAYKVQKNNKQYVFTESGLLIGPFGDVHLKCYSNDGKKLAYVTVNDYEIKESLNESLKSVVSTLCINDKIIDTGWLISEVDFLDDNELIYSISDISKKNPESYIHYGNKKYGPFLSIRDVALSKDKQTIAFSYQSDYADYGSNYYLCVANEKAGPYEDCYNITFSPDGKSLAYEIKENKEWYLIYNQKKLGPYQSITDITISDNNKLAYVSSDEYFKNNILHIGNFQSKPHNFIMNVKFFGDIISYRAEDDYEFYDLIVLEGKELVGKYINGSLIYFEGGKIFKE